MVIVEIIAASAVKNAGSIGEMLIWLRSAVIN
jgi:hypothetical protein